MHMRCRDEIGVAIGLPVGAVLLGMAGTPSEVIAVTAVAVALVAICYWLHRLGERLTDTTLERQRLAELTARAQATELANISARERIRHAAAAKERAADERAAEAELRAEQRIAETAESLRREYEETRALELCEAYEDGAMNERNGLHKNPAAMAGQLIMLSERRRTPASGANCGVTVP